MKATQRSTTTLKRRTRRRTADALRVLDRITGNDPSLHEKITEATINARLAEMLYDARIKAGLSQAKLAELAGTRQPVIARLENADYNGHSLTMIQRIARALNRKLEIALLPTNRTKQ